MSGEELKEKFDKWNPMEHDYKNVKFNQYQSGPGAQLDRELQPGQQAMENNNRNGINKKNPTLVFQHIPDGMTTNALRNICSRHGNVLSVRNSNKCDYFFVELPTVADLEAVFRALEKNNYGFRVVIGKCNDTKTISDLERLGLANKNDKLMPLPPKQTGIDYQSRQFRTSNNKLPRPTIQEEPLVQVEKIEDTGLPLKLLANDAHSLERKGLYKIQNNNNFNYHNGRSYISMPEKTRKFIEQKQADSKGAYHKQEQKFVHSAKGLERPNDISKCSQCGLDCDIVCSRCSQYYCSMECQLKDWPQHRYVCGKPKHLQKTPPPKAVQVDTKTESKTNNQTITNGAVGRSSQVLKSFDNKKRPATENKALGKYEQVLHSFNKNNKNPNDSNASGRSAQVLQSFNKKNENPHSSTSPPFKMDNKKCFVTENEAKGKNDQVLHSFNKNNNNTNDSNAKNKSSSSNTNSLSPKDNKKPPTTDEEEYKQNMPRSGNIVGITAITKTNVVFVRSKTYDANISYFNTINTLQAIGKNLKRLTNEPKCGNVVIAKFENQYNRALVLSVRNPDCIVVNFMDYGNLDQLKMADLYEAPIEFVNKPRHAIPVVLKDVPDIYMTQEIRTFMYAYLNNIGVEIRYKTEDFMADSRIYAVELIDENTQQNLNKMIVKLATPQEPQISDEMCMRGYLQYKLLPSGENIEFIVMDNSLMNSGCISCTTKSYAIEIEKFKKELQDYAKSIPSNAYTPRADELCIARYSEDGLWYRGCCLETVGDGHPSIHFFDYGNIDVVPIEDIRRYPRQFTFPIYTGDCEIQGLPETCSDELVAKLEQLIPNGKTIKCAAVQAYEEDHFYTLHLPEVINELTNCGLIEN